MKLQLITQLLPRKEISHAYSLRQSDKICKDLKSISLGKILSDVYLEHISAIVHSVFMMGYKGKIAHTSLFSEKHRTTVSHFLNDGKWESIRLEKPLKKQVVDRIYGESRKSGCPVFCIVDDTITSHTKPSSQAKRPIEAAYFHQSHLKKRQNYGHQAVGIMLACNNVILNYAIVLYDKADSKIEIVQNMIKELPKPPYKGYFLCDSWYASNRLMNDFEQKGFYTVGALRTNRIIYPNQVRRQAKQFAPSICKDDPNINLVAVGNRKYYMYRYQGRMNEHDDAVVLRSYPEGAFGQVDALRVFISTQTDLTVQEIMNIYDIRWKIEVFFRSCKQKLAFDKCQLRKKQSIKRLWLILSMIHYLCCTVSEQIHSFDTGFNYFRNCVLQAVLDERRYSIA